MAQFAPDEDVDRVQARRCIARTARPRTCTRSSRPRRGSTPRCPASGSTRPVGPGSAWLGYGAFTGWCLYPVRHYLCALTIAGEEEEVLGAGDQLADRCPPSD